MPVRHAEQPHGAGGGAPPTAPLRDDGGVLPPRTPSAVHDGCCLRGGASAALAVQPSAGCRGQCPVAARRLMRTARAGRAGPARGASRAAFRPRRPAPRQARASPAGSAMRPARAAQPPRRPARGRRHRQGLRRWLVRSPIGASCVEVAAPPRPHEMSATTGIVHLALPDRPWVDTDAGLRCVFLPSAAWRYARTSGGGSGQRPSGRRTVAGLVEHHRGRVADGRCVVPARTTRPAGPARRRAANFGGTGRGIATILALVS